MLLLGRMTGDSDSRREKDNDSLLSLGDCIIWRHSMRMRTLSLSSRMKKAEVGRPGYIFHDLSSSLPLTPFPRFRDVATHQKEVTNSATSCPMISHFNLRPHLW